MVSEMTVTVGELALAIYYTVIFVNLKGVVRRISSFIQCGKIGVKIKGGDCGSHTPEKQRTHGNVDQKARGQVSTALDPKIVPYN